MLLNTTGPIGGDGFSAEIMCDKDQIEIMCDTDQTEIVWDTDQTEIVCDTDQTEIMCDTDHHSSKQMMQKHTFITQYFHNFFTKKQNVENSTLYVLLWLPGFF